MQNNSGFSDFISQTQLTKESERENSKLRQLVRGGSVEQIGYNSLFALSNTSQLNSAEQIPKMTDVNTYRIMHRRSSMNTSSNITKKRGPVKQHYTGELVRQVMIKKINSFIDNDTDFNENDKEMD